ncbi:MAG: O-antigen ligase family protein [Cytophagales bacterium]|nr:O-antigen ligase family protein [Cytophagales bacterium]
MFNFLRKQKTFFYPALLVFLLGIAFKPLAFLALPVLLFAQKGREEYHYILGLFWLVLVFSDSRLGMFGFAGMVKPVVLLLAVYFSWSMRERLAEALVFRALWFVPFIVWALFCWAQGEEGSFVGLEKTLSYLLLLVSVPVLVQFGYQEKKEELLRFLLRLGVAVLALGFFFYLVSSEWSHLAGRYRGVFGNPNGLGIFITLFSVLYGVLFILKRELFSVRERWVHVIIMVVSLLWCNSRTALAAVLLFLLLAFPLRQLIWVQVLVLAMILGMRTFLEQEAVALIINMGWQDIFRIESFEQLEQASGRKVAFDFAWNYIQSHWWIGEGFTATENLFGLHREELMLLNHQGNAHNSFLTIWIDTGFIGLLLFLLAWLGNFLRNTLETKLFFPVLIPIVFSAFYESWWAASLNPFTIQLVMVITLSGVITREKDEQEAKGETEPIAGKAI